MNTTVLGLRLLDEHGLDPPDPGELPTGADLVHSYLAPIAASPWLRGRILSDTRVVFVSRESQLKETNVGAPADRALTPFRLLVHDGAQARIEHADIVIDASGTYTNPTGFGAGGMDPVDAPHHRSHIDRVLNDVLGLARARYAGKHVLLVGSGYSAATQAVALEELSRQEPGTRTTWVTRRDDPDPIFLIEDDPLEERRRLTEAANAVAADMMSSVTHVRSALVSAMRKNARKLLNVDLVHGDGSLSTIVDVDVIMALVGYQPDLDLDRELQVHRCYATEGPMKLASQLTASSDADCTKQGSFGPETLASPEPDFYVLGSKSYGRLSTFLLKTGHEQIRDAFRLITGDAELDLYQDL